MKRKSGLFTISLTVVLFFISAISSNFAVSSNAPQRPDNSADSLVFGIFDEEPDSLPRFMDSDDEMAFQMWISNNLKYPMEAMEEGIQGEVRIEFVIQTNGTLSDIKVVRTTNELLSQEVLRLVLQSPSWAPAIQEGKPVPYKDFVNIMFRLQ